jgi:hypothetical protein
MLVVTGIASIFCLLFLVVEPPTFRRKREKADQTEAVANARQISLALFEFETDYGHFPDWNTIPAVKAASPTDLELGTVSSNDFLRQLLVAGIVRDEACFHAPIGGTRRGDGVISRGEALKKGECGFTYLPGATSVDNPARPILVTPMIPGTDRFDPRPFKGKAVILKVDNSVASLDIDKHGHAILEGRNLMNPHHPVWRGKAPSIAWPDL